MLDLSQIYHIGVTVPVLDRALDELGEQMGFTWSEVRTLNVRVRMDSRIVEASARVAFSREGPPWFEVIEGPPDTIWAPDQGIGLHHVGLYVDDLAAETARLEKLGMQIEAANLAPDGTLRSFAYLNGFAGVRVELVDVRVKPNLEGWILGAGS
ncbi:MAG: VOC family protein [Chloroflexi bacterium]|nr:VOC family protein [Chloroflexota bacterium]